MSQSRTLLIHVSRTTGRATRKVDSLDNNIRRSREIEWAGGTEIARDGRKVDSDKGNSSFRFIYHEPLHKMSTGKQSNNYILCFTQIDISIHLLVV
jgi:hypothetical protein